MNNWNRVIDSIIGSKSQYLAIVTNMASNFSYAKYSVSDVIDMLNKTYKHVSHIISKHSAELIESFKRDNLLSVIPEKRLVVAMTNYVIFDCMHLIITSYVNDLEMQSCKPDFFVNTLCCTVDAMQSNALFDSVKLKKSCSQVSDTIEMIFNKRNFLTYQDLYKLANQCIKNHKMLISDLKGKDFNQIDIQIFKTSLFLIEVLKGANFSPEKVFEELKNYPIKSPMMVLNIIYKIVCDVVKEYDEYIQGVDYTSLTFFSIIDKYVTLGCISERMLHKMLVRTVANSVLGVLGNKEVTQLDITSLIKAVIKLCYYGEQSETYGMDQTDIVAFIASLCLIIDQDAMKAFHYSFDEKDFQELPAYVIDEIRLLGGISCRCIIQVLLVMFFGEMVKGSVEQNKKVANSWQNILQNTTNTLSFRPIIEEFQELYAVLMRGMYFPCEGEYENAVKCLYTLLSSEGKYLCEDMHVIMADLFLKKMVYFYVECNVEKKADLRKLLLKILYKFQEYSIVNFMEYIVESFDFLDDDVRRFIYENPSQHNMQFIWVLQNIKPAVIIDLIDKNIIQYQEKDNPLELYDTIVTSVKQLCKGSLPDLPSQFVQMRFVKFYYKILNVICNLHSQQNELFNNDFIKIMRIVLDSNQIFNYKSAYASQCVSNLMLCNDKTAGMIGKCKTWVDEIRSRALSNNKVIDISTIRGDLLNRCKDIEFVRTLNYRVVAAYLKPYMVPMQYSSDVVSYVIFYIVRQLVYDRRDIFFERLTSALILKKKLNTIQSISEIVLEVFVRLLDDNEELNQKNEVSLKSEPKRKKANNFDACINDLLDKYLCKWWYTILDSMFCGESLNQSIASYTIEFFVSEENLSVKVELALREKVEEEENNKYLILINRFKLICDYQENATNYKSDYPIRKGVLRNIITEIKYPTTDINRKKVLLRHVVENGSILFPMGLDHAKLQVSARLYYACEMNVYSLKFIYLMQVWLFNEFFYHEKDIIDISVLDEHAYEILTIANCNPEFCCDDVLNFLINVFCEIQDDSFGRFDTHSREMISI